MSGFGRKPGSSGSLARVGQDLLGGAAQTGVQRSRALQTLRLPSACKKVNFQHTRGPGRLREVQD